jgi:hypothetical protein
MEYVVHKMAKGLGSWILRESSPIYVLLSNVKSSKLKKDWVVGQEKQIFMSLG